MKPLSVAVRTLVGDAARTLGVADPLPLVGSIIDRTFHRPYGDPSYGDNSLTPGAIPFEPSFSQSEPDALRLGIEPFGPDQSPLVRRNETAREARRLVGSQFGRGALSWLDANTEAWRTDVVHDSMRFGAWFGCAFDRTGLHSAKIYYEMTVAQIDALPPGLARLSHLALAEAPVLWPVFTTIVRKRFAGGQRITFTYRGELSSTALEGLMNAIGIGHQAARLVAAADIALDGRATFPYGGAMIGLRETEDGVELKLEIMLRTFAVLGPRFLASVHSAMDTEPQRLAFRRWLKAFGIGDTVEPNDLSVLSIRVSGRGPARISLYIRPPPIHG